ncbi:MAG: LPS export ABC transporter periplasmic protein LptC [Tidjanibacter sp.]|nr:LPS export ABC transporter periplasmic protein LptC [Tidjanibacter sp.]
MVASLLGGATLLFSCSGKKKPAEVDLEKLITQQSDTLTMIYTKNGQKDYRFSTPLMERYELAREPYMEFRYGIDIITFDSLGNEASNLIADYAIYYENRELWEARGNVEGTGEDGRKLYTQQLFWDEKTDKVYSNVDCKVVDGLDVFVGEGFESDSEFKDWVFRESEGRMWVDVSESEEGEEGADSTKGDKGKESATDKDNKDNKDNRGDAKGVKSEQPKEKKSADRGADKVDAKESATDKVDAKEPATDKATLKRPSRIKGDSLRLAPRRQRGDKKLQQVELKGGEGFELKEADFSRSQRRSRE